jgi:hypothetical protein
MKTAQFELSIPAGSVQFSVSAARAKKTETSFWKRFWNRWFQRWDTPSMKDCRNLLFSQNGTSISDVSNAHRGTMVP